MYMESIELPEKHLISDNTETKTSKQNIQISPKFDRSKYTTDQEGNLRFDYLFSYWIYIWFLLYTFIHFKSRSKTSSIFIKYTNPFIVFIFGIIENVITLVYIFLYRPYEWNLVFKYLIMMLATKIIPAYFLSKYPIHLFYNTLLFVVIFAAYNIYLTSQNTNIYEIYNKTFQSLIDDDNKTPLYRAIGNMMHVFTSKSPQFINILPRFVSF
jgi:hypothetical protein